MASNVPMDQAAAISFWQLREDDDYTDVTIMCGEKAFRCHKVIVAAASPTLHKLFQAEMKEKDTQEVTQEVTLKDIDPNIMELLLSHMYAQETEVTTDQLMQTMEACNQLELLELKSICEQIRRRKGHENSQFVKMWNMHRIVTMGNVHTIQWSKTLQFIQGSKLVEFRENNEYTDFTILCGDKRFPCHRVVVSTKSPVLHAMFNAEMSEKLNQEVRLDNIEPDIMEILLSHMYLHKERASSIVRYPGADIIFSTIAACDYLGLLELQSLCTKEATKRCTAQNTLQFILCAETFDIPELKTRCSQILTSSLPQVIHEPFFLELSHAEVKQYFKKCQDIKADTDDVMEAALNWLQEQPNLEYSMVTMMQELDFSDCSVDGLESELKHRASWLEIYSPILDILKQARQQLATRQSARTERITKPAVIVVFKGKTHKHVDLSNWEIRHFHPFDDVFLGCFMDSFTQIPNGILMNGVDGLLDCHCPTNESTRKVFKQTEINKHSSIYYKGKVYFIKEEGCIGENVKSVDLKTYSWTTEPQLPFAPEHPLLAALCTGIMMFEPSKAFFFYLADGATSWVKKTPPPDVPSEDTRMVSLRDRIIVVHVGLHNKVVFTYNFVKDSWSQGTGPRRKHEDATLVCHCDKLYLVGREDSVEEYSIDTDTWKDLSYRFQPGHGSFEKNQHTWRFKSEAGVDSQRPNAVVMDKACSQSFFATWYNRWDIDDMADKVGYSYYEEVDRKFEIYHACRSYSLVARDDSDVDEYLWSDSDESYYESYYESY